MCVHNFLCWELVGVCKEKGMTTLFLFYLMGVLKFMYLVCVESPQAVIQEKKD